MVLRTWGQQTRRQTRQREWVSKKLLRIGTRLSSGHEYYLHPFHLFCWNDIVLVRLGAKWNIQGHKEPAEPIGKFDIRTTEEPARFWPAQKVSEVYFLETDMQDTVYWWRISNFLCRCSSQRKSGKCLNVRTQGNWKKFTEIWFIMCLPREDA